MALQAADGAKRKSAAKKDPAIGSGVVLSLQGGKAVSGSYLGRRDGAVWLGVDGGELGIDEPSILKMPPAKTPDAIFLKGDWLPAGEVIAIQSARGARRLENRRERERRNQKRRTDRYNAAEVRGPELI